MRWRTSNSRALSGSIRGPAGGEVVQMRQMSGCCQMALAKQRQHLCCRNVRHPKHEVMPTHERFGLIQNSDRAGHIALGESQAGEQYPAGSEGVDEYLLCQ